MKHLLLATGLALASAVSVSATVFDEEISLKGNGLYSFYFIPSDLVSVDSPRIFTYDILEGGVQSYVLLNDDFKEVKRLTIPQSIDHSQAVEMYFQNLNEDHYFGYDVCLTQTVFNNDENYEYITTAPDISGYQIVNDAGEVLVKITPPEGYCYDTKNCDLFKTESGFYLVVSGNRCSTQYENDSNILVVYKIDKATSSIQQISAYTSKMDVNPRLVHQTPITVTLDENTDYTSIDLINMSGCIVKSIPVNDEKTVIVDTSRLKSGVYVVKASGNNQSQETCKIIVQ